MINIGGDANDSSYRYKMNPLVTKIEGRGNGIKTVIVNMAEVAKQLRIDAAYPTKYFGIELGAQTKWNAATERAVVNGAHQTRDMQAVLGRFIAAFILCPACSLPEIKMKIRSRGITIDCAACGNNSALPGGHRLVGYMIKHHEKKNRGGKKQKKDKKKKNRKKEKEVKSGRGERTKQKEVESKWFSDTSKEAQAARRKAELEKMDHSNPAVVEILRRAEAENKEGSCTTLMQIFLVSEERSIREIVSEVQRMQLAHNLDDPKAIKVLLESLLKFDDIKSIPKQFAKHAELFSHFIKKSASIFLGCVEELVGVIEPRLLSRTPMILMALFEADVLDEEQILAWYNLPVENSWLVNKQVAVRVRQKARVLVDWLSASNEEEDEEEDEEDEED